MLEELAGIPAPAHARTYEATVAVLEAVRRAKADANLSMAAEVKQAVVRGNAEVLEALRPAAGDIQAMLKITTLELSEAAVSEALVTVETVL